MKKITTTLPLTLAISMTAQVKMGDIPTTIGSSLMLEIESTTKALVVTQVNTT